MKPKDSVDLFTALTAAKAGVVATLGKDAVAVVLATPHGGVTEVVDVHDVPDAVAESLGGPSGRCVFDVLMRTGHPVRIVGDALPTKAKALRRALEATGLEGLATFPLMAERAIIGYIAVPFAKGERVPSGKQDTWRLPCTAVEGIQLVAATVALRVSLARDRRRPAQLYDGVLVLDRWERVVLSDGFFERLPEWSEIGAFGRALDSLPGGELLASLPESPPEMLGWTEHPVPSTAGAGPPVALANIKLEADDGPLEGGRIVFARDLDADGDARLDGTSRMLALAMRVSHVADLMSHAIRLGRGPELAEVGGEWVFDCYAREINEAGRLVEEAMERCLPDDDSGIVDLNALLEEVLGRYRNDLGPEGVKLFTFLRPDLPSIPAERLALLRAVRILVQDARESLRPGGGTLTARTWADDAWVYGAVSDDGAGDGVTIPPLAEPLFEPRSQPHDAGLDAAREIVERLGGRLMVERRPGVWTRVTVMLRQERRRTRRDEPKAKPARKPKAAAPTSSGLSVLVVDDNAALRSVLRRYLERRGHAVEEATDGVEGLKMVREHRFDRLIVDIQMPNKDGAEFFEDLEEVDPDMRSRTIFVTGGFLTEGVERFIRESGRPSVKKPFDLAEMAKTVEA